MHCCELARTGQTLPQTLPDDWLVANVQPTTYADLNQQLQETISAADNTTIAQTYEEKRQKNYEVRFDNTEKKQHRQVFFCFRRETVNWNDVVNYYANKKNTIKRNVKNEVTELFGFVVEFCSNPYLRT